VKKRPLSTGPLSEISPFKIILPILLGLAVVAFLLYRDFNGDSLAAIDWDWSSGVLLLCAIACAFIRHIAYMWRLRILSDDELSWRQSFDVISLWEFSSSVTPTRVGGIAVALIFLMREKLKAGRAAAIVLTTVFLDSIIFIVLTLFFWLWYGNTILSPNFNTGGLSSLLEGGPWVITFLIAFVMMFGYTALVAYGLFVNPESFRWLLKTVFSFPLLRRWKMKATKLGEDVALASRDLRSRDFDYWFRSTMATFISWTFRFMVVNFLVLSVLKVSDHLLLYARQLALYQILVLTPTPGASGVADFAFKDFFFDFIGNEGLASAIGAIWRLITYYPYLVLGAVILPSWIKRTAKKTKKLAIG